MNKTYRWSDIFQRKHVIERLQEGPFGAYLDEFTTTLREQHYSPITIQRSICSADSFGRWLSEQKLTWADADETTVSRYHDALGRCPAGGWPHRVQGLRLAVRFLQQKGIVARPPDPEVRCSPIEEWLDRFEHYLERVVGTQASTRQRYRPLLLRFLRRRFGFGEPDWSVLSAEDLTAFIQHEAAHAKGFGRKVPGVALRSFLRFLVSQGLVRDGLAAAIPSPRQHLHATLPTRATTQQTPWRGAHLFRHTTASQMVNGGVSFKDVADVLGHQSLTTTSLYAKLNLETLAAVALPWPGGQS